MVQNKREAPSGAKGSRSRKISKKSKLTTETQITNVLTYEVKRLLDENQERNGQGKGELTPGTPLHPEPFTETEIRITELSSTGDGLGLKEDDGQVYVVPFTLPGDLVRAKIIRYNADSRSVQTDLLKLIEPSSQRDDSRIKCQYFAHCSGCQFQMMSYDDQLAHKKTIIERAYKNFSNLPPELIPTVENTVGSPMQYSYRTKLTPHFDGPPSRRGEKRNDGTLRKGFEKVPPIGFMVKGMRRTIDIEDCPIGTDAVRAGMKRERERVAREINKYKRGATILLRESTKRTPVADAKPPPIPANGSLITHGVIDDDTITGVDHNSNVDSASRPTLLLDPSPQPPSADYTEEKTCVTDSNATSTEYVDSYIFHNPAGAFFQNNNSILPRFTAYIRQHVLSAPPTPLPPSNSPPPPPPPTDPTPSTTTPQPAIRYLIDAYCGSALFTITLATFFQHTTGIDISPASILSARQNASANHLPASSTTFIAADAAHLFASITYPPSETVVIIDPPRKGCDAAFLAQLLTFGPRRVVYVSCNVHTQARDVGVLVRGTGVDVSGAGAGDGLGAAVMTEAGSAQGHGEGARYEIESLCGFDFFPQTGHVEAVAVLNRVS
ncbi:tRNA(m5U54)methyltransferase [Ptychographa xylographoides]|nr:tRNA(m5U54)methyltransferase [Ptychographa xylographoides]